MRVSEGEFGGVNVELSHGDSLETVPDSHATLLTNELRQIFRDPVAHLKEITSGCVFPALRQWLGALAAEERWTLRLFSDAPYRSAAGFKWESATVRGAMIKPALKSRSSFAYPDELVAYFSCIDTVYWNGDAAGYFCGQEESPWTLSKITSRIADDTIDPNHAFILGNSPCGDILFWTSDNRAGWLALGSKDVRILGTIGETINHVYTELCNKGTPGWKREWFA